MNQDHMTNLIKPIAIDTSQNFQLSLTVEVNFPRNMIIITWEKGKCVKIDNKMRDVKYKSHNSKRRERITWSTRVKVIINTNKWFLWTPLKTLISSGFRALNSLNIYKTRSCISKNYLVSKVSQQIYISIKYKICGQTWWFSINIETCCNLTFH